MAFTVTTREAEAGSARGPVYTLADDAGAARAEVWPFLGFNCLRWEVRTASGGLGSALHVAPDWATNPVPTRSGHPILFPFPNRLKGGQLPFEGRTVRLPLNESTGRHAIHGFTPRAAWRVVATRVGEGFAEVAGQLRLSRDLPAMLDHWPGDFVLTVTYRLSASSLEVRCLVQNPGPGDLPFGLGYHPYFTLPSMPGLSADEMVLHAPAGALWLAEGSLATGEKVPTPAEFDFTAARPVGPLALDHLYGDLPPPGAGPGELRTLATLSHPAAGESIRVEADGAFRELLLFTPGHRRAVAVEPYTCTTDAANFAARGVDAGWRVLAPAAEFRATVRYTAAPA